LGGLYQNGQVVTQDYGEAAKWYRMAAELGDAYGQFKLGLLYYNGQGIPQNYVRAHVWFNLAASQGENDEYASMRDTVEGLMTPEQVAEAQRLAILWQPGTALNEWQ